MVMSRQAVINFMEKEVNDYRWIKECSEEELKEELNNKEPGFRFKFKPFKHQLECIHLGISQKRFLFFLDMGTGKSSLALGILEYLYYTKQLTKPTLIVVPYASNIMAWKEEIELHSRLSVQELYGSKKKRFEQIDQEADLFIVNYDGLRPLMAVFKKTTKKNQSKKNVPNERLVAQFVNKFNAVVFDEIHTCRNHNSLTFKLCNYIAQNVEYAYGLTGTPFGRNPEALWSQFYLIDRGETLGTTLGLFRSAYFTSKPNRWGGIDHIFQRKYETHLTNRIQNRSIRYTIDECVTLPPLREFNIPFRLNLDAKCIYNEYVNKVRQSLNQEELTGTRKTENYHAKLKEICSGFLYDVDEETGERQTIRFTTSEKLEGLLSVLEGAGENKVVIFYSFKESRELIREFLTKHKIEFVVPQDSKNQKELEAEFKKFKQTKKYNVCLLHTETGGVGLNLQVANYCVFYEPTDKLIEHTQAMKRLRRIGQEKWVYIYHFYVKGSVEEKIIENGHDGKMLFKKIIDGDESAAPSMML